jgi:predicted nucleic acid-binding protein
VARLTGVYFDTSVLVAGMVDLGDASEPAMAALDAVAEGRILDPRTAWHCCLEFFSVTTRLPEEYRLDPATALRLLTEEIMARFEVDHLPAGAYGEFLAAAVGEGVAGGRIYDAHIGEIARRAGSPLVVTDNRRHFTPLLRHGIRVLTPAELIEELAG